MRLQIHIGQEAGGGGRTKAGRNLRQKYARHLHMIAGRRRACIFSTNVHIYGAWNAADGHLF
jgi:hypothetical protein